jgi:hypothetical protein
MLGLKMAFRAKKNKVKINGVVKPYSSGCVGKVK